MSLVRTYYLDWQDADRIKPDLFRRVTFPLPHPDGEGMQQAFIELWAGGLYEPGPWEDDHIPRTSVHLAICEALWARYNADDRPDGKLRRSMSMGDVVQIGTSYYMARSVGFVPVQVP